jgi:hypothetical protein
VARGSEILESDAVDLHETHRDGDDGDVVAVP